MKALMPVYSLQLPPPPADEQLGARPEVNTVVGLRQEIDLYWAQLRGFANLEPDQVLLKLSAISARVGEIRVWCMRTDTRLAQRFRTTEIDPLLEECDRQFKLHSRIISLRELDWRMTGGAPA